MSDTGSMVEVQFEPLLAERVEDVVLVEQRAYAHPWNRTHFLDALTLWARGLSARWLWLEVRAGNTRAMGVYAAHGFTRVGLRKDYYPAGHGQREDAVVMGLRLDTPKAADGT